jgi:chemotaxis protein CheD
MSGHHKARDLFLLPGALAFGGPNLRIRTLLGSCVSVVVWHPKLLLGGMCHFLLSSRHPVSPDAVLDGRYATDALHMLLLQMSQSVADVSEFSAHICGGANCFSEISDRSAQPFDIGRRNIETAEAWVGQHRLGLMQKQVGGTAYRHVAFDNSTGLLTVRQGTQAEAQMGGVIA